MSTNKRPRDTDSTCSTDEEKEEQAEEELVVEDQTPGVARKLLHPSCLNTLDPRTVYQQSVEMHVHIIRHIHDRRVFEVATMYATAKFGKKLQLHDPLAVMPSLSVLPQFRLLVHVPSMCVLQCQWMGSKQLNFELHDIPYKRVPVGKVCALMDRHKPRPGGFSDLRQTFIQPFCNASYYLSRGIDNLFLIEKHHVTRCKLYPLSVVLEHADDVGFTLPLEEQWKLAFHVHDSRLPLLHPVKLVCLLHKNRGPPPPDVEEKKKKKEERSEKKKRKKAKKLHRKKVIIKDAVCYWHIANSPTRLFYNHTKVRPGLLEDGYLRTNPRNTAQCATAQTIDVLSILDRLIDGSLLQDSEFHCETMLLPCDGDYFGDGSIQHQLFQSPHPVVTMCPSNAVHGAFESFMGFPVAPPPDSSAPVTILFPYLDMWTIPEIDAAIRSIGEHPITRFVYHYNPHVDSDLVRFLNSFAKQPVSCPRLPTLPQWILTHPSTAPVHSSYVAHTVPLGVAHLPTTTIPPQGFLAFVEPSPDGEKNMARWYKDLQLHCYNDDKPFAVQTFAYTNAHRARWCKLVNPDSLVQPGSTLLMKNRELYVVRDVFQPDPTCIAAGLTPTLDAVKRYKAAYTWVYASNYSCTTFSHQKCCSYYQYALRTTLTIPLPIAHIKGGMFNLGLHEHELQSAAALLLPQCPLPRIKFVIVYVPTQVTIDSAFVRWLLACMARATVAVIVYGVSRDMLNAAFQNL